MSNVNSTKSSGNLRSNNPTFKNQKSHVITGGKTSPKNSNKGNGSFLTSLGNMKLKGLLTYALVAGMGGLLIYFIFSRSPSK